MQRYWRSQPLHSLYNFTSYIYDFTFIKKCSDPVSGTAACY